MLHDLPGTPLSRICTVVVERDLDRVILRLYGEFDLSCDERFHHEAEGALPSTAKTLIVDLRGLTFMDSTGLRALVALHNRSKDGNLDFAVLYDGGVVSRVLEETGLDQVLPTIDTADVTASATS